MPLLIIILIKILFFQKVTYRVHLKTWPSTNTKDWILKYKQLINTHMYKYTHIHKQQKQTQYTMYTQTHAHTHTIQCIHAHTHTIQCMHKPTHIHAHAHTYGMDEYTFITFLVLVMDRNWYLSLLDKVSKSVM